MNKAELIAIIAEKSDLTKTQVETAFNATFDSITDILAKQDKIIIPGFGGFSAKKTCCQKRTQPIDRKRNKYTRNNSREF
jgi:DNA-binding protein HU-beta